MTDAGGDAAGLSEACLTEQAPGGVITRHALDRDLVRIGRGLDNHIVLADERVSRRHAEVFSEDGAYFVRDVGSRNGTFVNGDRVHQPRMLEIGDVVSIGAFSLQFEDAGRTQPLAPAPVLTMDDRTGEVRLLGELVRLTPKEYSLLRLLLGRTGAICERDEIARTVWPEYDGQIADYNIDNLVARLRPKIEHEARDQLRVVAVKKRGYRLLTGVAATREQKDSR